MYYFIIFIVHGLISYSLVITLHNLFGILSKFDKLHFILSSHNILLVKIMLYTMIIINTVFSLAFHYQKNNYL